MDRNPELSPRRAPNLLCRLTRDANKARQTGTLAAARTNNKARIRTQPEKPAVEHGSGHELDDNGVGPTHTSGAGRAETKP